MLAPAPRRSDAILDPIPLLAGCHPGELGGVPEWKRRQQSWGDWVASKGPWDLFGGLTFDPKRARAGHAPGPQRHDKATRFGERLTEGGELRLGEVPLSADVSRARIRSFLTKGEDILGRPIAAVVALEYHRNGWPHFHPLLSIAGGLDQGDIKTLSGLWYQACGYNRLEVPRDAGEVARYASKYLVKGLEHGDVLIWPEKGPLKRPYQERL